MDWRVAAIGLLAIASAVLLSAGLVAIFSSLASGHSDLPGQGSLNEMLRDTLETGPEDARGGAPVTGVHVDDPDPSVGSLTAPPGEPRQTVSAPSPTPSPAPTLTPSPPPPPPPPAPVAIAIPSLEVEAPVVAMGLDADRHPEVPDGPAKVAWYTFSAAPGQSSNAVFAAHVDWVDRFGEGKEGVFYDLHDLKLKDVIRVSLEDGSELRYRVTGNVAVPYDDPAVLTLMERTAKDVITLITCGGTWQPDPESRYGGNYSHRIIVRAARDVSGGADENE